MTIANKTTNRGERRSANENIRAIILRGAIGSYVISCVQTDFIFMKSRDENELLPMSIGVSQLNLKSNVFSYDNVPCIRC